MADTNLFDQGLESSPVTKTTPTASGNLFDQGLTGGGGVSPSVPESPSSSVSSNLFDAGLGSPNNGQPVPAPSAQDENQPWYKKAFDWTNTPTVDFVHLMGPEGAVGKAFGRTSEAGGFERGVENIVSGFTAPLSIALTLGTFGTGGLLESAGATALKEAGGEFAENLPQIMKAAKIATDAYKEGNAADPVIKAALEAGGHDLDLVRRGEQVFSPLNKLTELGSDAEQLALSKQGLSREEQAALGKGELSADARNEIAEKNGGFTDEQLKALKAAGDEAKKAQVGFTPVDDAIKAAGVDPALWNRAQKFLYDNGLTEHSLLGGDFLDRGAFQILRKTAPGWSIATTARAAETAKSIMSAGFTFQQLESASAMSPRFLDALKEGDTDKAWEYGTEMFASGTLGILGASHALHSAGELFKPLIENDAFRPNDQWLAIDRANKEREALHAEGDQQSINLDKAVRDILGHTNPGFLESVFGGSKEATAQKNLELATVFHQIVTGGDRVKAAQWYNALSEALGREDRLPVPGESGPNNGQLPPAQGGLGPTTGQLPPFSQEPVLGKPVEPPTREGTKVVHSNDAGEVRVGSDGRPIVWLSPEAWEAYNRVAHPGNKISGVSYSPDEAADISKKLLKANEPGDAQKVLDLFWKAQEVSKQGLLTTAKTGTDVTVAAEELQHTHQRELAQDGEIRNLFKPQQWSKLSGVIPAVWTADMDRLGYDKDPVTRVAETAAQFRSGKAAGIVPDTDITRFLDSYYSELEAKYGKEALESADRINEIAAQHVKDIYENRRTRPATPKGGVANQEAGNRQLSGLETGRKTGTPEVGPREPQEGLASRADEEFNKLSKLRLRVGMGDPGSAGLVTGDNEVLIGRDHADLAREAGYKATKESDLYNEMFRDGGVRIRTAGGVVHIDFMEPNADTWDRVYRSIKSVPDANKYYVDFRPLKSGTGFNISAYDKDDLLYRLKNLEEGNERPVRPGSVAAFRQGLFSRNYDVQETEDPEKFYDAINKVKEAHAEQGTDKQLHVYSPKEYAGMKTFLSPDGKTGFALKGDDIVSVFSHPTDTPGAAAHLLDVAVKNGGRRLDAFDTYLPKVYAREGFRVVARMPWNDAHAPEGWDYKAMKQYNNGRPDVVFMAFDPAHASATGGKLVGSYAEAEKLQKATEEPATASALFSRPNNGLFAKDRDNLAPTWYLKSNQLIDSRMSGPMPADTVLKMLENNGVKPDELKYTGLSDFLKEKGKEPVRPEEIRQYLAANNLQVQEVMKGAPLSFSKRFMELGALGENRTRAQEQEWEDLGDKEGWDPENPTKFGTYTLPGANPDSYREFVFSLPEQTAYERDNLGHAPKETFRSSHFPEIPNPIGHVRFNDRTGPNGEKLLHLEELQSDWHQKGRTQGYKTPESETLPKDWSIAQIKHPDGGDYFEVRDKDGILKGSGFSKDTATERALNGLNQQRRNLVPDAPFKKTWPELLMKRMIRYASENGYDGISWTPGEEQAARYDLSKQIDQVAYNPKSRMLVAYGSYGDKVLNQQVEPEKIQDYIGKEAAQKLLNTAVDEKHGYQTLNNADLKVGGEGMKGFYDKIVPEVANKLGKQFGAKVGETEIPDENKAASKNLKGAPAYTGPGGFNELVKLSDTHPELREPIKQVLDAHLQRGENLDVSIARYGGDSLAKALGGKIKQPDSLPKLKVPYFPITDSMRESVLKQGQPLFARESPNNGQDPQLAHQIDTNVFKNQPKDYQDLVMESLRRNAAGELSDREIAASKKLREEDGRNYEIGSANDLIHTFLENHLHRIYEEDNPKGKVILSNAKAGKFATNVSQARQQVYDSQLTALLKSPKKIMLDPIKAVSMDRGDLIKAAANRQLIDNLRDKFTRASDGRPAVVLSGSGQVVSGQNGEDPSIFVDPNRVRKINIDPKVIEQLSTSGDLQRYLENGTIRDITPYVRPNNIGAAIDRLEEQATKSTPAPDEHGQNPLRTQIMLLKSMQANGDFSGLKDFNDTLEKKYAWDPQDYVSLANNAMKGWNFITNSPDGTPVYVRSDIKVHPEFAEYLQNRLGLKESDISKNPVGKALLGAGTKLKQTLLRLSPFHGVQEALRGIMIGVNPIGALRDAIKGTGPNILEGERVDPSDPNSPTILHKLVENNFTTGTDYKAQQSSSEGLSSGGGLLNKAPGVGKVIGNSLNWYQDFLFKRYIPALKARAGELLFREYQRLHPDWSVDRVAKAAALHANDTFGGINWKAMGRSATTQDWGRLMFLAPDWLESEMRSGARLFNKDEGGLGRAQVAKMALGLWGIARVLNLVTTGNAHYEAPFGLATKNKEGKETVFSIRTLPTDLLHAASDPVGFVKGRLSPTVRAGEELVSGRDQFGRKLQPYDLWVDVFRNMAPIPLQAVGQAISGTGPEIGNIGQAVKAVGGTAQTYQTPAQKLAADLASSHTESGPIDPAQMARHSRVIQLEDQARAGEISWPDLYKLAYQTDQISEKELKTIQENVKATHGLPSDMASLYTRAARLPAKEFLDLWDVTNPSERAALAPLVSKVQKRYLAKAKKEMTPDERAKDPVFQRLVRMIPPSPVQHQNSGTGPQSYVAPPIIPPAIQKEVSYLYTATHPRTGHRVGSNDGQNWVDHQTGEPVNG